VLATTFIVLAIGEAQAHTDITHAGGYIGIATAIAAWYASFAAVTNSAFGRTVLPVKPLKREQRTRPGAGGGVAPGAPAHAHLSSPPRAGRLAGKGGLHVSTADIDGIGVDGFPNPGLAGDPATRLEGTVDARYRALIRHLPDTVVALYDCDLRGVSIDGPRLQEVGFPAEAFEGKPLNAVMPAADYERLEPHYRAALAGKQSSFELAPLENGVVYHVEIIPFRPVPGGPIEGVFNVARNVTERKHAEREAAQRTDQQAAVASLGVAALEGTEVASLMDDAVTLVVRTLGVEFCELLELTDDREALRLSAGAGWRPGLVRTALMPVGSEFHAGFTWGSRGRVVVEEYAAEKRFRPTALLRDHKVVSGVSVTLGGKRRPFGVLGAHTSTRRSFRPDEVDFLQAIANVLAEAIVRQSAESKVRHQALHDPLTGLPNRSLLLDRLDHWAARAERDRSTAAVLFVDLDNFKVINDALGHDHGDRLLCSVADRLQAELRPSDTIARVGGDEFVVFCEDIPSEHDALAMVERLVRALDAPFDLGGQEQHATASVGIAFGDASCEPEVLIRNADVAMYRAKERGRARYELFDDEMRERSISWLETESDLRRALDRGELRNVYQPIVSPKNGRIVGFEALVRWDHPKRGVVSPADFIPIAEQSGLIVPLGRSVLHDACSEAVRWNRDRGGREPLRVAVNFSPRQLNHPRAYDTVAETLERAGLAPDLLCVEITESALVEDASATGTTLGRLKELGVRLALDDFGTGYSSLTYVRRFPIDTLKIDRSFIDGIVGSSEDEAIVTAVLSMGRALGVHVVAEGVETEEQATRLRSLGCKLAQGYLFSRPVGPEAVDELLAANDG
jgi:diguanylate cyclase (GGDEF)-like protein/PAS domain S-box-containing protein